MLVIWYKLRLDCFSTCGSIGVDKTCSKSVLVFIWSELSALQQNHTQATFFYIQATEPSCEAFQERKLIKSDRRGAFLLSEISG